MMMMMMMVVPLLPYLCSIYSYLAMVLLSVIRLNCTFIAGNDYNSLLRSMINAKELPTVSVL
jgi:hypothetical protein